MESDGINTNNNISSSSSSSSSSLTITANQRTAPAGGSIRFENPFTLKVGQVFTGFGVGCGLGIGVGRPLNLGAIPVLGQVMSATRGATDAFSGVGRHANDFLRKYGPKNIEAGIGCGIGFGHGFGVGLAVKPGALHPIQTFLMQTVTKMMMKFGLAPDIFSQSGFPVSLPSGTNMTSGASNQNAMGSNMQMATTVSSDSKDGQLNVASSYDKFVSKNTPLDASYGSRTEQVINNFLQSPLLNEEKEVNQMVGKLQSENNMLQMVLKHQQLIEELMEENEKLRQILVEDLKVSPSKIEGSHSSTKRSTCSDCFECRRKQRRK